MLRIGRTPADRPDPTRLAINLALREIAKSEAMEGPTAALEFARRIARDFPNSASIAARIAPLELEAEGAISDSVRKRLLTRTGQAARPMPLLRAIAPHASLEELQRLGAALDRLPSTPERAEAAQTLGMMIDAVTRGSATALAAFAEDLTWAGIAADWAVGQRAFEFAGVLESAAVARLPSDDPGARRVAGVTSAMASRIFRAAHDPVAASRNGLRAQALVTDRRILTLVDGPRDPVGALVKEARGLAIAGEPTEALTRLRHGLAEWGDDERLWLCAGSLEGSNLGHISADVRAALVRWLPGAADAVGIATCLIRFSTREELAELQAALRDAPGASQLRARAILGRVAIALGDEAADSQLEEWVTDRVAVQHAAMWSTRHGWWELSPRLESAIERVERIDRDESNDALGWALFHASRVRAARGDSADAVQLATRAAERVDADQIRAQLALSTSDEDLALHGWPRAQLAKTTARKANTDGAIGYVLQSSLPYTTVGYATRSADIASNLIQQGWPIHCVTRPGYPFATPEGKAVGRAAIATTDVVNGVPYSRIPAAPTRLRPQIAHHHAHGLIDLDEAHHWQLLHAASNAANGLAAIEAANTLGVPSIYEVRGLWHLTRAARFPGFERTHQFAMFERLETETCHAADRVLTLTHAIKSILIEQGVPGEKITVVPNGADWRHMITADRDPEAARSLGLDGKVVVGYVGSLLRYEGLDVLLRAFAKVAGDGKRAALLIVGEGEARAGLERLARTLGIEDFVRFTGRVDRDTALACYAHIDIAPFPRLSFPVTETVSPLKPFEAMAWSKAVVTSDVAPLREVIDHGRTGLVAKAGDDDSLGDALELLIADEGMRGRLGAAANEWVRENRDWSAIVARIGNVYRELGASPRS